LRSIFASTGKCASSWPEPECRSARNPSLGVTRPTRAPALRPVYFSHYCHTHHKRTERVLSGIFQFLCIRIRPCSSERCLPRRVRMMRRGFARVPPKVLMASWQLVHRTSAFSDHCRHLCSCDGPLVRVFDHTQLRLPLTRATRAGVLYVRGR